MRALDRRVRRCLASALLIAGAALPARSALADIRLPAVFSDSMVLQRDLPLPVWGLANPGENVTVSLRDAKDAILRTAQAAAGADGRFSVTLDPMPATSDPLTMRVEGASSSAITVKDVLVGEVWLCGGQSNMEFPVGAGLDAQQEIAAAAHPRIRLIKAPHRLADSPHFTIDASWSVCSPQTAGGFTGVGYFFAQALEKALDVPIGLISANWGGTHIQPWIPVSAAAASARFGAAAKEEIAERKSFAEFAGPRRGVHAWEEGEAYGALCGEYWAWYEKRDQGWAQQWWKPMLTEGAAPDGWKPSTVPSLFGDMPGMEALKEFDGLVWLRRALEIPAEWAGHELELRLGTIDDSDTTWWNGQFVGRVTSQAGVPRWYTVPKELVKAGRNEIVIAVVDDAGAGGLTWPADAIIARPRDLPGAAPIALAGTWLLRAGTAKAADTPTPPKPPRGPENPALEFRAWGAMYDGMIAPFVPFAMRGAIWYQGESNEDDPEGYRSALPLLVESWRDAWKEGDFPFGIVQLANFRGESNDPVQGGWAFVRDAQLETLQDVANTGLAVTIDVGDAGDIHPRDKRTVGRRLAGWALSTTYGKGGEWSGPIFREAYRRGGDFVLCFDHAAGGLKTRDGKAPGGFALAGKDGAFVWADARIEGDRVVLSAKEIPEPARARYAWSDNPTRANLVNGSMLPASPFRTDRPAKSPKP